MATAATEGTAADGAGAFARSLRRLVPAWLLLAAFDLAAAAAVEESWLRTSHLGPLDRVSLFAGEMAGVGAFLALVAILLTGGWRLAERFPPGSRDESVGGRSEPSSVRKVRLGALALFYLGYLGSWATYRSTGRFLDNGALHLWATNPLQVVQHVVQMEPWTLILVPAGVLVALWMTERASRWLASRDDPGQPYRGARRYGLVWLGTLLLVAQGQWSEGRSPEPVVDPEVGTVYSAGVHYSRVRSEHTGPLVHLAVDVARVFRDPFSGLEPDAEVKVRYPPRPSLEDYVSRVPEGWRPPANVVLILVESLRADQLTDYGSPRVVMPQVEELADRGRVWLDVYAQSSHSNYADLPPLSSQYPLRSNRTHVYPEDPPYPRVLLYDILERLGYRTAIYSSQNEHWGGMINYLRTGGLDTLVHSGNYDGPTYTPGSDLGFGAFMEKSGQGGKVDDRFTVAGAIRWVRGGDRPFFLYMNLQNSHVPYTTPEDFETRFGPEEVDFPIRFGRIPEDEIGVARDVYANSLAYVDHQISRFVEALEEAGIAEETIVIISGDTGQGFYEHGFGGHAGPLYDEVMRVPLVMAGGPVEPGRETVPVEHVDLPPTLLHLLGLPPHPGFQGCDLMIEFPPEERNRYLVAQSPLAHQYAIVRGGWKLIFDAEFGETLLFDLREDPAERQDRATVEDSVVASLSGLLGAWRQRQVEYYRTPALYREHSPPVVEDGCRRGVASDVREP